MDKAAQLQTVLGRLSPPQAIELARAVELNRALGREAGAMPTEPILDALRPMLRVAKPQRVPTLQRLICAGFDDFLTDHVDEPRLDGLIPRSSLSRWWQAITMIAADEIHVFETKLREQLNAPVPHLEALQHEAWDAAARWSATAVAERAKPKSPVALRQLLPNSIAQDIDVIAHVLPIAKPLNTAIKTLLRVSARLGLLDGRYITDLAPDCITLLKKEYLALSESHGMDARFLALGVLNRLQHSHQILRLGRALSWKSTDTLVANTELHSVGERLIGEIARDARAILLQMPRRGPLPVSSPRALGAALAHYLDESEGVLSEIGVRRDSPWGIALLKNRTAVADAIDEDFLDRFSALILALLPRIEHPGHGPDLSAPPSRETINLADEAAGFLKLLLHRGERHGFAKTAHEALIALSEEVGDRISDLCDAARTMPGRGAVIEAQARAMAELYGELFDDEHSTALMRQITAALHAPAL
jgi:hypothetical protein